MKIRTSLTRQKKKNQNFELQTSAEEQYEIRKEKPQQEGGMNL